MFADQLDGLLGQNQAVRSPRLVPADEPSAKQLKERTLPSLYNERPMWLQLTHRRLDEAVFAAYGWDPSLSDDDLLAALLALNLQRRRPARWLDQGTLADR